MVNITLIIRERIEILLARKEITLLEYTFSLGLLLNTRLFQELYESKGSVKTIVVTHHAQVVNLMNAIANKLPSATRVLTIPFPTPASLSTGETAKGVADGFSVMLTKTMEGMLTSFPEIVGLSIGVQYDRSSFPGALIWLLNESDLIPIVDTQLFLLVDASRINADSPSQKTLSSSFAIPEGTRKATLAKTTATIMEWLSEEHGSSVLMACAAHVLEFKTNISPPARIITTEGGGPSKKRKVL